MKLIEKNKKLIKYLFSAGISFTIDQVLFNVFNYILGINLYITLAKLIARAISSFINYLLNSKIVFKNKDKSTIIKYYIIVVVQAFVSGVSTHLLKLLFANCSTTIISIVVDVILFFINYFVQNKWVFKKKEGK